MTHEPPSSASNGEHVDLEQIADFDEDLLPPDRTAAVRAHLDECAECRQRLDELRNTQMLLSGLPDEPMPAAVSARIDAALAALPATTIVPLAARRRGWRAHPTAAGLGAAATVAALVAAIVVGRTSSHSPSHGSGGATDGAAAAPESATVTLPQSTTSGTNYTAGNLARTVPALTHPQQAAALGQAEANPTPSTAKGTNPISGSLLRLYSSPAALEACVRKVEEGGSLQPPLAIDFATYQGAPSVLIVLPGLQAGNIDAWFVGPGCNATQDNLLTYSAVPASPTPGPSPGG